jgi:transposase
MLLAGEGGWRAWPDPYRLTFAGVSLARSRAGCRVAAQRFGVSASSAIRWRAQERREGDLRPKRQGGDRHSQRIEAHAELILSAVAAKSDMTLAELRERLKERGVAVAIGTLWRFFKRRKITRKKRRRTPPNSAATR